MPAKDFLDFANSDLNWRMNYWLSPKTIISKGIVEIKRQVVWKIFPIILTLICL